jgi:hypothetical protein
LDSVLLVGTRGDLVDLDTGRTLVIGHAVTALAEGPRGWHALLDRQVVVRLGRLDREDGEDGDAVETVGELPEPDGQSLAVLDDGSVVVGRTGARLALVGDAVAALTAFEHVPDRDHWKNPAAPTPDARSLAASGIDLWVNVHVGGLWHSGDKGESWRCTVEPDADIHEVRAESGRVVVAAAVGFGWSEDQGATWSWTTDGLHAGYLRAVTLDGEHVYVSASDGPFTTNGAVYRARLGSPFVRCEQGLPERFQANVDTAHLDAAGGRAVIGFEDRVYVSGDDGVEWSASEALTDAVTAVRLGRT